MIRDSLRRREQAPSLFSRKVLRWLNGRAAVL